MSRTEDRRREKKAKDEGYVAGLYSYPKSDNPYKAANTRLAYDMGWERGVEVKKERRSKELN